MRSAAEGEHRTGEDVGEAEPLTPMEAMQPIGKGEVKGNAAVPAPAASRARTDAGSPETEAVSGQAHRARSRHKKPGKCPAC